MTHLLSFRRFILLLLSFTLCTQAMAVASLGACHRMRALTATAQVAEEARHAHADLSAHHDGSMHHQESRGNGPSSDDARGSCAACASCHLSSIIVGTVIVAADIPAADATVFQDAEIARVRNVASGLERPPTSLNAPQP